MNKHLKIFSAVVPVCASAVLFLIIMPAPVQASQTPYTFTVQAYANSSSLGLYTSNGGNQPCANPNSNLAPSGGIQVNAGDVVSGTASGSWTHDPGIAPYGPNGFNGQSGDICLPQLGVLAMKLVADDGTVTWLSAGSSFNITMSKSGTLYFAFSDSDQTNNSGSVSVSLNVTSQSQPQAYCANGTTMTAAEAKSAETAGALTVSWSNQNNQATAQITNTTGCTAPLSASSYKMFQQVSTPGWITTQQYIGTSGVININANGTTDLTVPIVSCATQIDLWYQNGPTHMQDSDTDSDPSVLPYNLGPDYFPTSTQVYPAYVTNICSACTPNASQKCVGNAVYNFDSCGTQGSLVQQCTSSQTCSNGQCVNETCTPNWQTGAWSACSNGQQTRSITDSNNCGVNTGEPITTQSCSVTCSSNSDCGTNALTGSLFCQGNGVYQNYTTFTCNNPGAANSSCSSSSVPQLQSSCGSNQTCQGAGICTSNPTNNCSQNSYEQCVGNSLYWYSSCGTQLGLAQYCPNGCYGNTCQNYITPINNYCSQNSYQRCSGNYLYWYDSCGNQESQSQYCPNGCYGNTCQTYNYVTTNYNNSYITVTKTVRNLSNGSGFSTSTTANPGDILMFMITLQSAGNTEADNVFVRDNLPSDLIYNNNLVVACSATNNSYNNNNCNSNNYNYSGNITSGINLNTIYAGQTATITYQVQVAPASSFAYGTTTLNNNVSVTSSNGSTPTASASVTVTRTQVYGASSVSTGLTNNFWTDSFFFPLALALLAIAMWRSGLFFGVEKWFENKKKTKQSFKSERELRERVAEIRKIERVR